MLSMLVMLRLCINDIMILGCSVQLSSGISPVASLVNSVGGKDTYVVGGCMFALANRTNITSLQDLVDMKVCCTLLL